MAHHLLSDLVSYFTLDEINIDNVVFKLYYKVSTVICMLGATIGVAQSYFGKPITCSFNGNSDEMMNDYCWMHGGYYYEEKYQEHLGCVVDMDSVDKNSPQTHYYQWVTFVFAIQAAIFFLPYKIWSTLEGGLMASFGADAKSKIMVSRETEIGDECLVLESIVERFVKYFKCVFHRNSWYFISFVTCEVLNFFLLALQFDLTDKFLSGRFAWYGYDAIRFLKLPKHERRKENDPMCAAFPKEVSCDYPDVGAAGGFQIHNGICVLTQNIINEKIYLIFWFWFVILGGISILFFIYRVLTLIIPQLRFYLLYQVVRHPFDADMRKHLQYILNQSQLGDWFVLYQLSKNCNSYFFREFIRELSRELTAKPKQSLSSGQKGTSHTATSPSQQQTSSRVLSLLSRLSANHSNQNVSRNNTFDSRLSQITQMGPSQTSQGSPRSGRQSQLGLAQQGQVRLSTILQAGAQDSDSDVSV